jgi:hypothetical protein
MACWGQRPLAWRWDAVVAHWGWQGEPEQRAWRAQQQRGVQEAHRGWQGEPERRAWREQQQRPVRASRVPEWPEQRASRRRRALQEQALQLV